MTMTKLLFGVALVCLLGAVSGCAKREAPDATRPNLIIILADDLGYNDLTCYWQRYRPYHTRPIETPNIDRMAEGGVLFTDYYAAASVCTPSRAALLTGCYALRIGLQDIEGGVLRHKSPIGLNPDELTIAESLKARGYATTCIGKWHLGDHPTFYPTRHGFDTHYGTEFIPISARTVEMIRDEKPADVVALEDITRRYTEEAIDFIDTNRNRPFFLYLAHNAPHVPLAVSEDFKGKSKRGLYGDVVVCLDWSVGQILDELDRLGITDRTLVIFTSDNGPATNLGHRGGSAYPLSRGKGRHEEGGFRVPCVMWWPGRIPAGTVCGELVAAFDIMPTFCNLVGAPLATNRTMDGRDIWPLVVNEPNAQSPHEAFYYYQKADLRAVRGGQWKLVFAANSEEARLAGQAPATELYDLANDPGELSSMIEDPEADRREALQVQRGLKDLADMMRSDLGDANVGMAGKNRRPPGRVEW